eukprot:GILK01005646.1.p1 GENE.GILK01005646.1~~GILK01005646.1.p1  ORF type:complete len:1143 (+),score=205.41 GILK01005646.1:93-3431(+)
MSQWNYVVTAQKPTSVSHSLTGNFTGPNELNLIIAKSTRIEIYRMGPEGLQPILDVGIYGRISTLRLFRPEGEPQDLLFVSTERYKFCVLAYDSRSGEIITRANGDVQDRIGRPSENGQIGIIDPQCRLFGLHLYDGLFKVIPVDAKNQLKEAFNIRLEELMVLDIVFLHGCAKPTICVLHQDPKEARHVKTYEVLLKEKMFGEGPWYQNNVEGGASLLIPLPLPLGGVIIIGEQTISYHSGTNFKSIGMKTTNIKTFGFVDPNGSRILLGDIFGALYVLVLQHDESKVLGLTLELLGETCLASTISYLDNGYVYIGSTFGDPQLIKLNAERNISGSYIEVVERFTNLGPIVDFCVVDLERQGQGQVVTCSGAFKDGSLRVIRNGIGINELETVDMPGLKGIWSLRPAFHAQYDQFLVVSFIGETRVLAMNGSDLEEANFEGFESNAQTIFCTNVLNDLLLQISENSVRLVATETFQLVHQWVPPSGLKINVGTANASQVVVATGGGNLVYLEITDKSIREVSHCKLEHEIACINVTPLAGLHDPYKTNLCAVGMWTDTTVRLLTLPALQEIRRESMGEVIPRSVLMASFEDKHYLLCALGDGHLVNFSLDVSPVFATASDPASMSAAVASGGIRLADKKKISLGTQPIVMSSFTSKGNTHVFAASDRPTVIYSSNKKLLYSNVNLKEVTYVCPFNTEAFPDCLALATENSLTMGSIDEIQKLHIRTIPLGEQPRRIVHHEQARVFALLTVVYALDANGDEVEKCAVRLLDDQTFETTTSIDLDVFENGCALAVCTFNNDPSQTYLVVGTAYALPDEPEPRRGRLLVYTVVDKKLQIVTEKETKGAVYTIHPFNGKLLGSVNSKIQIWKFVSSDDGNKELTPECGHHGHILALYTQVRGDFIVVGDLMKSISLLLYKPIENTIEEIARDYNSNWMTAVEILDDDTFIGAENSFNLFTVKKNNESAIDDDRGRLDNVGQYHLGEFINKFRHGSLVMSPVDSDSKHVPTLIFGTVNGVIGLVASLPQDQYQHLYGLQTALTQVIKGVGGFIHSEWRSFHNERKTGEARGFLDGDLIESFLDLNREKMDEVVRLMNANVTVEDLCKRVEELARLH